MGLEVSVNLPKTFDLEVAAQRGALKGGALVGELSNANAPTEPEPRHRIHMTETLFVRAVDPETVVVGYEAFWAPWQEAHEDWNHPHGGESKFLELAVVAGQSAFMEAVAESVREAL